MKKLLIYLKDYKKESILAPAFKMLEALFDLFVPIVVARMINHQDLNDMGFLYRQFGLLLLLALLGLTCSFTAQYFSAKASVGFTTKLRQALFDHIQGFSFENLDDVGSGTLITRLTADCNQIQNGLNLTLRLLLRSPFIVFGAMIMAFTINVKAALIFVIVIPVLALVVFTIMLKSIPLFKKVQKSLDDVLSLTRENLNGVRVIRAFRKEQDQIDSFHKKNAQLTNDNQTVGTLSAMMNPLTYVIINIATIVLIYSGAMQVSYGTLLQGDVVALYNYMAQIVVELIKLASLIITIDKSLACAQRVQSVLETENTMQYTDAYEEVVSDEAVSFDHVSYTYHNASAPSLSDISFTLNKGETLGIIGPTGSGKSTLVSLISRFYDAQVGTISVSGQNIRNYPADIINQKVGIVMQKAVLFEGTVRENMQVGNENASDEEIWQALETAQAAEVVHGKQNELDFHIEQNGRNLSGGQKQRLAIARTLLKNPEILILDDSSSALDFVTDAKLRQAVSHLPCTTIIISQRTSAIRHCNQILVLDDGNLVGKGTHEELMQHCQPYQETYYSQFPEERPGKEVLA